MVVAEVARLGGAAAGARDRVPAFGQINAGPAGQRVEINDGPSGAERREAYLLAVTGRQRQVRNGGAGKMVGGPVIVWHGQVVRQSRVVGHRVAPPGRDWAAAAPGGEEADLALG